MGAKKSAGLLMFRRRNSGLQVLLVHPGGPFWVNKDAGAWSIPKGEYEPSEDPLDAAKREFQEETGFSISGPFIALGSFRQPGGKTIAAWAFEGDCDPRSLVSNLFALEWPPKSGQIGSFPEVDRAEWFDTDEAKRKILKGQVAIIEALEKTVLGRSSAQEP